MKSTRFIVAALIAFSAGAHAQGTTAPTTPTSAAASIASMTQGEVRKVDKEAGKITLRHEALVNLDMPAMTMVFRVAEPKFLDAVKQGDMVRFVAERVDGQFTVTELKVVPQAK